MHTRYKYLNDLLLFSLLYRERKTILSLLHTHTLPLGIFVSYPLTEVERQLRLIGFNVTQEKHKKTKKKAAIFAVCSVTAVCENKNVATRLQLLITRPQNKVPVFFIRRQYLGDYGQICTIVPTHNLFIYKSKKEKKRQMGKA